MKYLEKKIATKNVVNFDLNAWSNCQIVVRFHNTENKATTLDDSKSWTTIQKLGASKISPYTRYSNTFTIFCGFSAWRTCNSLRALRTS